MKYFARPLAKPLSQNVAMLGRSFPYTVSVANISAINGGVLPLYVVIGK
ncbi:MAG: hypothetical protein QM642_07975 [Edaphocola sp.]